MQLEKEWLCERCGPTQTSSPCQKNMWQSVCVSTSSHRWVHVRRWCRFSCRGHPLDPPPPRVRTDVGERWCLWSTCCSSPPDAALPHKHRRTTHSEQIELMLILQPHVDVWVFWLGQETNLWPSCWNVFVSAPLCSLPSSLWPPPGPPPNPTPPYISSPPGHTNT